MTESTQTPKPTQPTLGQEVVRSSVVSAAATAAAIVGMFGGLVIVNKLGNFRSKETDTENTPESEPTES